MLGPLNKRRFFASCILEAQDPLAVGRVTPILPGHQLWTEPLLQIGASEPEHVELVGDGDRVLVRAQAQRRVALNASRVPALTVWEPPHLLIVGHSVVRLESGIDLQGIREQLFAWNTIFDRATGLWKRAPLEEYARLRRRRAAMAVVANSTVDTPLQLQSLCKNVSKRLRSHQIMAYLGDSQFAIVAEDESAQSLAEGLRTMASDGLAIETWEGERWVRLPSVSTDVQEPLSLQTSIDLCVRTIAAMDEAHPKCVVISPRTEEKDA